MYRMLGGTAWAGCPLLWHVCCVPASKHPPTCTNAAPLQLHLHRHSKPLPAASKTMTRQLIRLGTPNASNQPGRPSSLKTCMHRPRGVKPEPPVNHGFHTHCPISAWRMQNRSSISNISRVGPTQEPGWAFTHVRLALLFMAHRVFSATRQAYGA